MDLVLECQKSLYITAILRVIAEMEEQVKVIEKMIETIKQLSDSD